MWFSLLCIQAFLTPLVLGLDLPWLVGYIYCDPATLAVTNLNKKTSKLTNVTRDNSKTSLVEFSLSLETLVFFLSRDGVGIFCKYNVLSRCFEKYIQLRLFDVDHVPVPILLFPNGHVLGICMI